VVHDDAVVMAVIMLNMAMVVVYTPRISTQDAINQQAQHSNGKLPDQKLISIGLSSLANTPLP